MGGQADAGLRAVVILPAVISLARAVRLADNGSTGLPEHLLDDFRVLRDNGQQDTRGRIGV